MSLNIDKIREKLKQLDAQHKSNSQSQLDHYWVNHPFDYTTTIFIGSVDSPIRIWLGNVIDIDSRTVLIGAVDAFFHKVKNTMFNFNIKLAQPGYGKFETVSGKITSLNFSMFTSPNYSPEISMYSPEITMKLGSTATEAELNATLRNHCYFYLTGEIEGQTHTSRLYNPTQDIYEDRQTNIITGANITTLCLWQDHTKILNELVVTVPF